MNSFPRDKEVPHADVDALGADEFHSNASYTTWRSRGTNDWLLIFTLSGRGLIATDGEPWTVGSGEAVLYQPGTPQSYGTDPDAGRWKFLWSHFHLQREWGAWLNWSEKVKGLRCVQVNRRDQVTRIATALRETVVHHRQRIPGSQALAVNALERALILLHIAEGSHQIDERVRRAVDILASEPDRPFSMAELARRCAISSSRLAHLFSEQIGRSPQQYHEEVRLQRAAQLLRSTVFSIQEIAAHSGYEDPFYFSNRFRKAFGKSPSAFRRTPC